MRYEQALQVWGAARLESERAHMVSLAEHIGFPTDQYSDEPLIQSTMMVEPQMNGLMVTGRTGVVGEQIGVLVPFGPNTVASFLHDVAEAAGGTITVS